MIPRRVLTRTFTNISNQSRQFVENNTKGVFFGCFGNPMAHRCNRCDHYDNYQQYLHHFEFHEELGLTKTKSDVEGFWIFLPK